MNRNIKNILLILKNLKVNYLLGIFIIFLGVIVETLSIGIFIPVISSIVSLDTLNEIKFIKDLDFLSKFTHQQIVIISVTCLILIFTLRAFFLFFLTWYKAHLQLTINTRLSKKILFSRLDQEFIEFYKDKSSNLLNLVTLEITNYSSLVLVLFGLVSEFCIFLSISIFIVIYKPVASLTIISIIVILGSLFYLFTKGYTQRQGKIRLINSKKQLSILNDAIGSFVNIKLYKLQNFFLDLFSKPNLLLNQSRKKINILKNLPKIWFEFLIVISMSVAVLILFKSEVDGENVLIVLGVFAAAAYRILPSITKILSSLQSLKYNFVSVDNIIQFINVELVKKINENQKTIQFENKLNLNNLSFNFKDKIILSNLSLEIKKNNFIGVTGQTGSGKSTFLHIVSGLLKSDKGEIQSDGVNIYENIEDWRSKIAYLPQKSFYLDDTIKNNIIFGSQIENIDNNKFDKIIKICELNGLVRNLKRGADTLIGENGSKLSGGQLQRIGLARCLYREPKILLLDESTSALDTDTENKILKNISELDLTVIFVTHRKDSLSFCDKVYNLENHNFNHNEKFEK